MNELVVFDIDGTIVDGQSQRLFLKYLKLNGYVGTFFYCKLMLWFILYKIGIAKDPKKAMEYAFSFLRGKSVSEINTIAQDFFVKNLKRHIYPEAIELIKEHEKAKRTIILVSNAADILVKEIARNLSIPHYISTVLEVSGKHYSGKIIGSMYGDEKTDAIKVFATNNKFDLKNTWAYGDHFSDRHLLSVVGHPVAVNPSPNLASCAQKKQWPVLLFKSIKNKL